MGTRVISGNSECVELAEEWYALQPLSKEHAQRLWQRLRLEWSFNSNHIEGNTLTYGETLLLLIHGRTRGEHLIREYEEMRGHDVAIEHLRELVDSQRPISEGDIRDLNQILLKEGFWRVAQTPDGESTRKWIEPGRYKTQPNHVLTAAGTIYQFASPEEIPALMGEFVKWMRTGLKDSGVELTRFLAELHARFIRIHPFDDGNGRLVRLLLNYVLLKEGLPPMVIKTRYRDQYLRAIASTDSNDLGPLQMFFEQSIKWSLKLGISAASTLVNLTSDDDATD